MPMLVAPCRHRGTDPRLPLLLRRRILFEAAGRASHGMMHAAVAQAAWRVRRSNPLDAIGRRRGSAVQRAGAGR